MSANKNYQLGLLYLTHLLINADGTIDEKERNALAKVKNDEQIADSLFLQFQNDIGRRTEREIYQQGIELINECNDEEKLTAFAHLYKISESDGHMHIKEVRLMLYSIRQAKIEFDDVIKRAKQLKSS